MKKLTAVLLIAVCCIILSACNSGENETKITSQVTTSAVTTAKETIQPATTAAEQTTGTETTKAIEETTDLQEEVTQAQNDEPSEHADEKTFELQMTIGNTPVSVDWEDNEAVDYRRMMCRQQPQREISSCIPAIKWWSFTAPIHGHIHASVILQIKHKRNWQNYFQMGM